MSRKISILSAILLFQLSLLGQTVSLVLSGGGAKGLAHVGVIKALEENGIPISNVSGTSMGAIVGGLYAMGYSPDEMVNLFKSRDFRHWSSGKIDSKFKYNINDFSAFDAENLSIGLTADKKGIKPEIVSSYTPSVGMDIAFEELCAQASAYAQNNFDKLFIPFRCNASDVLSKRVVYFRSGNLGHAIRTSMTFPMYFKPIYVDSVLLFDGGIYNNFLWNEALAEFSPDFIIGSKVASNTKQPSDEDPLLQVESMIVGLTDYSIPDSLGLVIDINFTDVGLMDFDRVDEIVDSGYFATLKQIDYIKSKIKTRVDLNEVNKRRGEFRAKLPKLRIKEINISGLKSNQRKYVNSLIFGKKQVVEFEEFKKDYYRLMSDRVFLRFFPVLSYSSADSVFNVDVNAKLKRTVDI